MSNINFYELKDVKKHLPKTVDKQKEFTGMSVDSRILICGASGSGKTNALMNYIQKSGEPAKGTFKHIFLCFKTIEPLYSFLSDQLEDDITTFRSLQEFPNCASFPDQNEKSKDKYLLIFDDCINDDSKADIKKINEFFAFGRKKSLTIMFLSQSYFKTAMFIRQNIGYVLLTSIASKKDLSRITKEYSFGDVTGDDISNLFDIATQKESESDMPFFKIDLGNVKMDVKFSRNFTEYFEL